MKQVNTNAVPKIFEHEYESREDLEGTEFIKTDRLVQMFKGYCVLR